MDIEIALRPPSHQARFTGVSVITWNCPNCQQRLGDVVGERVVIKVAGRNISIPLRDGIDQSCPRCGAYSELRMLKEP